MILKYTSYGQKENQCGIFQFESAGMTKFMKELKPDSLEDIIAGVSLYRPRTNGPDTKIYTKQIKSRACSVYASSTRANIKCNIWLYGISRASNADS